MPDELEVDRDPSSGSSGGDVEEMVDGSADEPEHDTARGREPTEHEIQWYFAIARFLLWVLAVVVVLIVVSRALN